MEKSKTKILTIVIIIISIVALALIGVLIALNVNNKKRNEQMEQQTSSYKTRLDNQYQQALYNLNDSLMNMDSNLSKLSVSSSDKYNAQLLLKVEANATVAQGSLSALPISKQRLDSATKFTNQMGDYCKNLSNKMMRGDKLSAEDSANLKALHKVARGLYKQVSNILDTKSFDQIDEATFKFDGFSNGLDEMMTIDDNTFEYPKLIYDGPFSDAENKTIKNMGAKLPQEQVKGKALKLLGEQYEIQEFNFVQEVSSKAEVYQYQMKTKRGDYYVEMTKDGRVAQIDCYKACDKGNKVTREKAIECSQAFAKQLGFDVKAVWVSKTIDSCIYVNLCPVVNGIIIYPDLIKMVVDDDCGVVGVEAYGYLTSHEPRKFDKRALNSDEGVKSIKEGLEIVGTNAALIPLNNREVLCYEYECKTEDAQYFIYVDVKTLEQVEVLKIIKGTEGFTVM